MLRLVLLEDNPLDAVLIQATLAEGGLEAAAVRAQTRREYQQALAEGPPDLILADFSLPGFDGMAALRLARETCPEVPFLFVSGAIGEELAIESLRSGATDYVLKQRLERLVPAVRRALAEAHERAERRRLEDRLRRQAEELAEAHERKDEFLAMLCHEMRNPLAPIRNALQIIRLSGAAVSPMVQRAHEVIERQVQVLGQLVEDLLDVSRIARGKIEINLRMLDLRAAVARAVDSARPLIEQRRHALTVEQPDEPLWVCGDLVRLEQVLVNLLNNSAKYTDPGGRIDVTAAEEGGQAVVRVRDNGIGMTRDLQARAFEMFAQAEQVRHRAHGGLGIGLTLVRRLVDLHHGSIEAFSEGPGQGSEFTVRLPLQAPAAPSAAAGGESAGGPAEQAPRRVLVVDDNRDGAESLALLLELWGHHTMMAHDGPQALRHALAWRPDLVLLDIGLPGMDGYEVARRLTQEEGLTGTVLVALTGYGQEADRRRSREVGLSHHLIKPLDPAVLQRLLAGLAGRDGTPTTM